MPTTGGYAQSDFVRVRLFGDDFRKATDWRVRNRALAELVADVTSGSDQSISDCWGTTATAWCCPSRGRGGTMVQVDNAFTDQSSRWCGRCHSGGKLVSGTGMKTFFSTAGRSPMEDFPKYDERRFCHPRIWASSRQNAEEASRINEGMPFRFGDNVATV